MPSTREQIQQLDEQVARCVVGQKQVVESLMLGLLCNSNLLLDGYPGTDSSKKVESVGEAAVFNARKEIHEIHLCDAMKQYIIMATR